ncbi:hypothetical protein K525DRAFT_198549 [Schizophyllum commune Loenen D]|nr:hypothetical protein K525DRAFT_198549 [Schizophyllum commune Loenen D]
MHRRVVVFHARGLPAYAQYHNAKDPFRCISDEVTEKDHKDAQRQWVADLKVIILRGWNDDTLRDIERGMDAYQALKRSDLLEYAHEIYGHITSEDRVVGYVTGARPYSTDRTIQPRDKKLVYSAVARLHRAGLCYAGFHESNTLPIVGRVKFIDLAGIEPASEEGNRLDWESVERLFSEDDEGTRTRCVPNCIFLVPYPTFDHKLTSSR